MKVIVAGYAKTGTKTLCSALSLLGYNVYDYVENAYYLHKDWLKIFDHGVRPGDFQRMYEGVDAVTDSPCFYYWKELSEAFPDAKIVLMIRDEDSWYRSLVKQATEYSKSWMALLIQSFTIGGIGKTSYRYHTQKFLFDVSPWPRNKVVAHNENTMKRMYREHNLYVQTNAPKDRLLVYKLSDGWKPLCDFLGKEVPNETFPHKNKGGALVGELLKTNKIMARAKRELLITLAVFTAFLAFLAVYFGRCAFVHGEL